MSSVILASKSAARAALLMGAGVVFKTIAVPVDEAAAKAAALNNGATPEQIAEVLAEEKALALSSSPSALVIGADQTLDLDGRLFDKAENLDELRQHLIALRGRVHRLHSAVVLAQNGTVRWRYRATATIHMRRFSDLFLQSYLNHNGKRLLSCVGGYELEGPGAQLIDRLDGDYFSVLGLPLLPLLSALRAYGALVE